VPLSRSRAQRFDELVLDAVERLEQRWESELRGVEFAVEDVPGAESPSWDPQPVPLGRLFPATASRPARIVLYRRPIETRALDRQELADLVHDVVVERVAELLGLDPDDVEAGYDQPED
jgi:predicted Zn-dependent protease with MMP-like domain